MPEIEVYTTPVCPYCRSAKELLRRKGVWFHEINVHGEPQRRAEMIKRARGRTTVPQVFVGDKHLGGCNDLYALE
jgi:glutaredoxin 3